MEEGKQQQSEKQLVVFDLANEVYGMDIGVVLEIIRMQEITKVPRTPEFVEGIINLRGKIIPVVDLRKRFSLPVTDETADNRIVVVDIDGQGIGMVVDAVAEVMRINSGSIEPPSEAIITQESDYLLGIAKLDDRLIILLDMNKLLLKEERKALAQTELTPEPSTA